MHGKLLYFFILSVQIIFECYIFLLILRLFLQLLRANPFNPVFRFINKTTDFFVKPLQRWLPAYHRFSFAIAVLVLVLKYIEVNAIVWLRYNRFPGQAGILLWTCGSIAMTVCNISFYTLFLRVIFNWIGAGLDNTYYEITYILTEPLLKPVRRVVPPLGMFDLSPLIIAILLQFIIVLLLAPVLKTGQIMALKPLLGAVKPL